MKMPRFPWQKPVVVPPTPDQTAQEIIKHYTSAAGYAGVPGAFFPHSDTAALVPMWAWMIWRLARCYDLTLGTRDSLKIATAIVGSAGSFYGGVKTAGWYFSLTGIGVVPVVAMNASLNAGLTYSAGQSVAAVFSRNDLDPKDLVPIIVRELAKMLPIKIKSPGKPVIV